MGKSAFNFGDKIMPADPENMLEMCHYYSMSGIAYGVVAELAPEYAASVGVQWVGKDGDTRPTVFWFEPSVLSMLTECDQCGHSLLIDPDLCDACGNDYGYRTLPKLTNGASSQSCLDAGIVCSIWRGHCTECGAPEDMRPVVRRRRRRH